MTTANDHTDVVIVGAGAGGAISAKVLAERGINVVCLEQGPWHLPESRPHSSPDWEWRRLTDWHIAVNQRQAARDYPIDTSDEATLMWSGVGGSTAIYTATWPRFRPTDFRKGVEHGLAPDWPITYEDLAPFYEMSDQACGISGWDGDPAIPPRGAFQTRPLPPGPVGPVAARGFDELGWHWWPMPCAIIADEYQGRPACNNCGNCQSGCPRGSLNDMAVTHWPQAIAAGVDLRTDCRVEQIETDKDGRATGVVYVDRHTGVRFRQTADVVIVAANGVGTPRLLLMSEGAKHPNGLANSSDQVGRNLMHHMYAITEAWVDEPTDTHQGVTSAAHICEEFAETDTARGFVNGFTMHICRMNGAGYQALGSHSGNTAPWGAGHHDWFAKHFAHGVVLLVVCDDLPLPHNRVTLSDTVKDSSGLPAPQVSYRICNNDARLLQFAVDRTVDMAKAMNAWDVKVNDFRNAEGQYTPPCFHWMGTARMGDDPASSVVNKWHQAWDCPNLYLIDSSALTTGGAVNPTSTVCALAYRAATNLADRFAEARTATETLADA